MAIHTGEYKKPCSACGEHGHRSDNKKCPKFGQVQGACTYCKRKDGTHSPGCKRKAATGGGKRSIPSKIAKISRPVLAPEIALGDNGVRATAKTLLGQLEALRTQLDQRIESVRELAAIL